MVIVASNAFKNTLETKVNLLHRYMYGKNQPFYRRRKKSTFAVNNKTICRFYYAHLSI